MPRPLIRDLNVRIARGQDLKFRVVMSPAQSIAGWTDFGVTLREDPEYPRTAAADVAAARSGDLDLSDWTVALESTDATVEDEAAGIFYLTCPRADTLLLQPGTNRYAADVWRLDSGSYWQLVEPVWVSVLESVYDG